MSVKAMNWAWDAPGLTTAQRVVLVKMADAADPQRFQCWPSVPYLAEKACLSERQVMRVLAQLANPKRPGGALLKRTEWRGKDGAGKPRRHDSTYLYTLPVREGVWQSGEGAPDIESPGQIVTPDICGTEPLTSAPGAPDICDTEPLTSSRGRAVKEEPTTEPTTEPTAGTAPAKPGLAPDADAPERVRAPAIDFGRYAREWNEAALVARLPLIEGMNLERRRKLRVRLAEPGFDWPAILAKLTGTIGGWLHKERMLDFDFITKNQKGYTRLLEGRYDGGQGAGLPSGPATLPEGVMVND